MLPSCQDCEPAGRNGLERVRVRKTGGRLVVAGDERPINLGGAGMFYPSSTPPLLPGGAISTRTPFGVGFARTPLRFPSPVDEPRTVVGGFATMNRRTVQRRDHR
jgi:hypothetical protein